MDDIYVFIDRLHIQSSFGSSQYNYIARFDYLHPHTNSLKSPDSPRGGWSQANQRLLRAPSSSDGYSTWTHILHSIYAVM